MLEFILIYAITFFLPQSNPVFVEEFDRLDSSLWLISEYESPGGVDSNIAQFRQNQVSIIDGYLRIQLNQDVDGEKYNSLGGEIVSVEKFGYGTYEFRMRTSSTSSTPEGFGESVSGSVSGALLYAENAITEIDFEFEGNKNNHITHLITWKGSNDENQHTPVELDGELSHSQFYVYSFIWTKDSITFYRDGELMTQHTGVVPTTPGSMIFNLWGSDSQWWGGEATPNIIRYLYVDWFRYTPL